MTTGRGATRRDRWLIAVVPVLLASVALTQMVVASTTELTPWRGAGFGMFSTMDGHDLRGVRIEVVTDDGDTLPLNPRQLRGAPRLGGPFVQARAWPTPARLDRLGEAIIDEPLLLDEDDVVIPAQQLVDVDPQLAEPLPPPVEVRLEIHRLWLDRDAEAVVPEVIAERTVHRDRVDGG